MMGAQESHASFPLDGRKLEWMYLYGTKKSHGEERILLKIKNYAMISDP